MIAKNFLNPIPRSRPATKRLVFLVVLSWLGLVSACQADSLTPPRVATQTALDNATPTPSPTTIISEAPTATPEPGINEERDVEPTRVAERSITLWVNETSPAHGEALKKMAADFSAVTGIQVDPVLVSGNLLPELVRTAVVSNTLPDLIIHPADFTIGWANDGILDPVPATEVVDLLGRQSFDSAALELVTIDSAAALLAAIPSDGWHQLIIYRADWLEELGLPVPNSYETLFAAAEAIFQPDSIVSGLVIPTDSALVSTQRAFEHIATANGCELVDEKGEVTFLHPDCLDALEFYRSLINQYSPVGLQTDTSALNAYLAGRTGIIMASPSILPALAGLDEQLTPTCPECVTPDYLMKNSGILVGITAEVDAGNPTTYGVVTNLGITATADTDAAKSFAQYWFTDGYSTWLSVNPERKVPMRWDDNDGSRAIIDAWGETTVANSDATLIEILGGEVVSQLSTGIADSSRWGFRQGQGELITAINEDLVLSGLLQEMLSGYFTSSQTVIELYHAVVSLIPDYAFPIESRPTATPE